MKPGRELDKLVAEIVKYPGRIPPRYSTSSVKAIELFEWLENYYRSIGSEIPCLIRGLHFSPCVALTERGEFTDTLAIGESYPHAIALAVIKTKNQSHPPQPPA